MSKTNVSLLIRTFQNTDVQPLCRVLSAHYAAIGLTSTVVPLTLELCVLAKPYFDSELLLVAELDHQVVGFMLLGYEPDSLLQSLSSHNMIVSCLCVLPGPDEQAVARELISQSTRRMSALGVSQAHYCPPPPATPYLAGLVPGDGMIGLPDVDQRLAGWLRAAGWQDEIAMGAWQLDLAGFQLPMDRTQIQIRRTAQVDRLLDEPLLPWYVASVLGHTEPVGFRLTGRRELQFSAEVILWMVGHELLPQPELVAQLWPLALAAGNQGEDQLVFLIAESLRQLRQDRVDVVRTVTPTANVAATTLLNRLGFGLVASGRVMSWRA